MKPMMIEVWITDDDADRLEAIRAKWSELSGRPMTAEKALSLAVSGGSALETALRSQEQLLGIG